MRCHLIRNSALPTASDHVILAMFCFPRYRSGVKASGDRSFRPSGLAGEMQKIIAEKGWTLLPLRLMIGFGFAAHGYAKLSRGPDDFAVILTSMRVPQPHLVAWVTSLFEFIGGFSVMIGAFVVPLSLPLAVIMLTAMFSVHFQYGFSSIRLKAVTASGAEFGPIGYEMNLLYIAGLLTLALGGSGRQSVDHLLGMRKQNPAGQGRSDAADPVVGAQV